MIGFFFAFPISWVLLGTWIGERWLEQWPMALKIVAFIVFGLGFIAAALVGAALGGIGGVALAKRYPAFCPLCRATARWKDWTYECTACQAKCLASQHGPWPAASKYVAVPLLVLIFGFLGCIASFFFTFVIGALYQAFVGIIAVVMLIVAIVAWKKKLNTPLPTALRSLLLALGTVAPARAFAALLVATGQQDTPWKEIQKWELNDWSLLRPLGLEWWIDVLAGIGGVVAYWVILKSHWPRLSPKKRWASAAGCFAAGAVCLGLVGLRLPLLSMSQWNEHQLLSYSTGEKRERVAVDLLRSPDLSRREAAAAVLEQDELLPVGLVEDTAVLLQLEKDDSLRLRALAAIAWGQSRHAEAPAALARALENPNYSMRTSVAVAIGKRRDPALLSPLMRALAAEPPSDHSWVFLGNFHEACEKTFDAMPAAEVERAARAALPGATAYFHRVTIERLLSHRDADEQRTCLLELMRHADTGVREMAVRILGEREIPAYDALFTCVDDPEPGVAQAAFLIIDRFAPGLIDRMSDDALLRVTRASDETARNRAWKELLTRLSVERTVAELAKTLRDNESLRAETAKRLAALGSGAKAAVPALLACIEKKPEAELLRTLVAIWDLPNDAVPALAKCLSDDHYEVRTLSAQALAGMGLRAGGAFPACEAALSDPEQYGDEVIVGAAATIVGKEQCLPLLKRLLDSDKCGLVAAREIARLSPPAALKKLPAPLALDFQNAESEWPLALQEPRSFSLSGMRGSKALVIDWTPVRMSAVEGVDYGPEASIRLKFQVRDLDASEEAGLIGCDWFEVKVVPGLDLKVWHRFKDTGRIFSVDVHDAIRPNEVHELIVVRDRLEHRVAIFIDGAECWHDDDFKVSLSGDKGERKVEVETMPTALSMVTLGGGTNAGKSFLGLIDDVVIDAKRPEIKQAQRELPLER